MDQIFPPQTQQQFVNMFKTFEKFTRRLIVGEATGEKLRRTFAGLFAIVGIGVEVLKFFWRCFRSHCLCILAWF